VDSQRQHGFIIFFLSDLGKYSFLPGYWDPGPEISLPSSGGFIVRTLVLRSRLYVGLGVEFELFLRTPIYRLVLKQKVNLKDGRYQYCWSTPCIYRCNV